MANPSEKSDTEIPRQNLGFKDLGSWSWTALPKDKISWILGSADCADVSLSHKEAEIWACLCSLRNLRSTMPYVDEFLGLLDLPDDGPFLPRSRGGRGWALLGRTWGTVQFWKNWLHEFWSDATDKLSRLAWMKFERFCHGTQSVLVKSNVNMPCWHILAEWTSASLKLRSGVSKNATECSLQKPYWPWVLDLYEFATASVSFPRYTSVDDFRTDLMKSETKSSVLRTSLPYTILYMKSMISMNSQTVSRERSPQCKCHILVWGIGGWWKTRWTSSRWKAKRVGLGFW